MSLSNPYHRGCKAPEKQRGQLMADRLRLVHEGSLMIWSSSPGAPSGLPGIVRNLIAATVTPTLLRMPGGSWVNRPGVDGEVESAQEGDRFVPFGRSVWEVSTESGNAQTKAARDYRSRVLEYGPETSTTTEARTSTMRRDLSDPKDVTYVCVTTHPWADGSAWAQERRNEQFWKDVRVIEGSQLLDWLELAPTVAINLLAAIGHVPADGLSSLEYAWQEWRHLTNPPMSEELVLAGRLEEAKEFITRLTADPKPVTVTADSLPEAVAFCIAALRRNTSEETRAMLEVRTIVVDDDAVLRSMINLRNHILILKCTNGQVSGHLVQRGCFVVVPEGNPQTRSSRGITLGTRPDRSTFATALEGMGIPRERALHAADECGRSLAVYQRRFASANAPCPTWAAGAVRNELVVALLAGSWEGSNVADQAVVARLAGVEQYAHLEDGLHELLVAHEPPLRRIGDVWTLSAPVDAFELLARRVTPSKLAVFRNVFQSVFSEIDPLRELHPDERPLFPRRDQATHSTTLRRGLCGTLLHIARLGQGAGISHSSPQLFATEVVGGIPGLETDWRLLATWHEYYTRLMEAAPGPLLGSLEQLLEADPEGVRRLFIEGTNFGASPAHTAILWGLEVLAWDPKYLGRACLILARLAALDPGGQLTNRPINSLRDILLWWHPGTGAPLRERLHALDLVLSDQPQVGRALVWKLLPTPGPSIARTTAKPRWKPEDEPSADAFTPQGLFEGASAIVDRAVALVAGDASEWRELLACLRVVTPEQREKIVARLEDLPDLVHEPDTRSRLSNVLREVVSGFGMSCELQATDTDMVGRIQEVLTRIAPTDPVERHRWLFDSWMPDVSFLPDVEAQKAAIAEHREGAIQEILATAGMGGVIRLASVCELPGFVSEAIVPLLADEQAALQLLQRAIDDAANRLSFVRQICAGAFNRWGQDWHDLVIGTGRDSRWSASAVAAVLQAFPDAPSVWKDAASFGAEVETEYWRHAAATLVTGSEADQEFQCERLLAAGRALELFRYLSVHPGEVSSVILLRVLDTALFGTPEGLEAPPNRERLDIFYVDRYLQHLRARTDIPREEIAGREYGLLPLLGTMHSQELVLHELLTQSPDLFVQLVCDAFRPAHRDKTRDLPSSEEETGKAHSAFTLLHAMHRIPGSRDGDIDAVALVDWIRAARVRADEVDRLVVTDQLIGGMLAFAPGDPDDHGWPHQAVREAIETIASDEIDHGLCLGHVNKRGVYSKSMYEGGTQERSLAAQCMEWAVVSGSRWPRTSRLLQGVAEMWEDHARREDERAEMEQMEE